MAKIFFEGSALKKNSGKIVGDKKVNLLLSCSPYDIASTVLLRKIDF